MVYLGVLLNSLSFRASPAQMRVEKLLSIGDVFLPCEEQPVSSWLELLGVLSSMIQLVPGSHLWMRSLQILRRSWDRCNQSRKVRWTPEVCWDLEWWLVRSRREEGVSLAQVSPQLDLWSEDSDVGWGAHLGEDVISALSSPEEAVLSINARELLAAEYDLWFFTPQITNSTVALFVDNSTAITYLCNQGGTPSHLLNSIAQRIFRWAESIPVVLAPQFIMGRNNMLADFLLQAQLDLRFGMDSEDRGLSGSTKEVASFHRSFRLWVERQSVPRAGLPHPWVDFFALMASFV